MPYVSLGEQDTLTGKQGKQGNNKSAKRQKNTRETNQENMSASHQESPQGINLENIPASHQKNPQGINESSQRNCITSSRRIIHSTRTLDEFYYDFSGSDEEMKREKDHRNKTQVVTQEYEDGMKVKKNESERVPVVRVNQIWVRTIGKSESSSVVILVCD